MNMNSSNFQRVVMLLSLLEPTCQREDAHVTETVDRQASGGWPIRQEWAVGPQQGDLN